MQVWGPRRAWLLALVAASLACGLAADTDADTGTEPDAEAELEASNSNSASGSQLHLEYLNHHHHHHHQLDHHYEALELPADDGHAYHREPYYQEAHSSLLGHQLYPAAAHYQLATRYPPAASQLLLLEPDACQPPPPLEPHLWPARALDERAWLAQAQLHAQRWHRYKLCKARKLSRYAVRMSGRLRAMLAVWHLARALERATGAHQLPGPRPSHQ